MEDAVEAVGDVDGAVPESAGTDADGEASGPLLGVEEEGGAVRRDGEGVDVRPAAREGAVVEDRPAFAAEGLEAGGCALLRYCSRVVAAGLAFGVGVDAEEGREADQGVWSWRARAAADTPGPGREPWRCQTREAAAARAKAVTAARARVNTPAGLWCLTWDDAGRLECSGR
jgi:hypothetical protein